MHTAEPLVPEPSAFGLEMAIEELKRQISLRIDQIPAELIIAVGRKIHSQIRKLINSIWNIEELPDKWKELIIVPICKNGVIKDCGNYRGVSLLPTTYKMLSNILLSRLTPYAEENIGARHCGYQHNRSITDHIFGTIEHLRKMGIQ